MDLSEWGFGNIKLLEKEDVVLTLGSNQGLSDSAMQDNEMVLLTHCRILHLVRRRRRWQALVANLEDVDVLEVGNTGRNSTTLVIGGLGLVAGLLGWLLLDRTSSFLPLVTTAVGALGALLLLLLMIFPDRGSLVFRVRMGQISMSFNNNSAFRQASTLVNHFYALQQHRWKIDSTSISQVRPQDTSFPGECAPCEVNIPNDVRDVS